MNNDYIYTPDENGDLAIRTVLGNESSSVTDKTSFVTTTTDGKLAIRIVMNGSDSVLKLYASMPVASADNLDEICMYVGTTTATYTNGYIYQCQLNGTTYSWIRINTQPETTIINNYNSTSATAAASANLAHELNERIDSISGRGRFLSVWNCVTGLPETNPPTSPYEYKSGDFFIVGTVSNATPAVNYQPNGSQYVIGVASTTVETEPVSVNDTYIYDGTTWKLQNNTQKEVSFSSLAGSPYDNTNLAGALEEKANVATTLAGYGILDGVVKGHEVIAFQTPTAANNYTWYRLYADGWVEQGGTASGSQDVSVTFPVLFRDANYQLLLTFGPARKEAFMNQYWSTFGWETKTATGFTCTVNGVLGIISQDWVAYGMAASA